MLKNLDINYKWHIILFQSYKKNLNKNDLFNKKNNKTLLLKNK